VVWLHDWDFFVQMGLILDMCVCVALLLSLSLS